MINVPAFALISQVFFFSKTQLSIAFEVPQLIITRHFSKSLLCLARNWEFLKFQLVLPHSKSSFFLKSLSRLEFRYQIFFKFPIFDRVNNLKLYCRSAFYFSSNKLFWPSTLGTWVIILWTEKEIVINFFYWKTVRREFKSLFYLEIV